MLRTRLFTVMWALAVIAAPCEAAPPTVEVVSEMQDRFAYYIGQGWTVEQAASGLTRWFGHNVETSRETRETTLRIVLRDAEGNIYYMQTVAIIEDAPK